jgi:ribosome-associated translation inhibitor RaiA
MARFKEIDMALQPHITFRHLDTSEAVKGAIERHVDELEQFYDRMISCRVVVDARHYHRRGRLYHVSVTLFVPGSEIVVNRDPSEKQSHEDVLVAVRDSMESARRQLEDYVDRMRA